MKILVTGSSGFLGQYLCTALLNVGHKVDTLKADLLEFNAIENIISLKQPDIVIHLAAKTEVALSFDNYLEVSQVNYVGTVNLAEANRKHNPNLKLFLMASTMETYGTPPFQPFPFTEETSQYPMAPYAVAKMACEYYLKYMGHAYNFPYCILRQTNAYGRTDNNFFVMERIISQMVNGDVCNLGEALPIRNFIWVDDLVKLYLTVIEKYDLARGEVFVTGPDNGIAIAALADMIKTKLNWQGKINWGTIPKRPGEVYYLNSNPQKAKEILGWQPETSLSEGIDKAIAIAKGNK